MARVVVAQRARTDLSHLIASRRLPKDTRERVRRSLSQLETFPLAGRRLIGGWQAFRLILGPWPWMLLIYQYDETTDTVTIFAIHDARTGSAATSAR
jgi:mRNA-degrading endonuclease RelE of RelBE toxin-antitoxin system